MSCEPSPVKSADTADEVRIASAPAPERQVADQASQRRTSAAPVEWDASLTRTNRQPLNVQLTEIWKRLGDVDDTTLVQPVGMIVLGTSLVVTDYSVPRVTALAARDGRELWSFGKLGSGPSEWRGPLSFSMASGDTVAVWDQTLRRLSYLSSSGTFLGSLTLDAPSTVFSVCVERGKRAIVNLSEEGMSRIATVDLMTGAFGGPLPLTWRPLQHLNAVAGQVRVRPTKPHRCLVAPLYWAGARRISDNGEWGDSLIFVEQVPAPVEAMQKTPYGTGYSVTKSSIAAINGIAEIDKYIVVAFAGRTAAKDRLLDFYDSSSGRYVGTIVSDVPIKNIAGIGSTIFLLTESESGLFDIRAMRVGN